MHLFFTGSLSGRLTVPALDMGLIIYFDIFQDWGPWFKPALSKASENFGKRRYACSGPHAVTGYHATR